MTTAKDYNKLSDSEKKKEDWMNSKWRPMMGWMYMIVCTMDMVVFPVLWSLLQTMTGTQITQWNPLTLQGAGLFHIAMGAVLGIAAFGRTQEKLNGANNGGAQLPASGPSTFGSPSAGGMSSSGSFGAPTPSFGTPPAARGPVTQPAFTPSKQTFVSSSGKPGPMPEQDPEL